MAILGNYLKERHMKRFVTGASDLVKNLQTIIKKENDELGILEKERQDIIAEGGKLIEKTKKNGKIKEEVEKSEIHNPRTKDITQRQLQTIEQADRAIKDIQTLNADIQTLIAEQQREIRKAQYLSGNIAKAYEGIRHYSQTLRNKESLNAINTYTEQIKQIITEKKRIEETLQRQRKEKETKNAQIRKLREQENLLDIEIAEMANKAEKDNKREAANLQTFAKSNI